MESRNWGSYYIVFDTRFMKAHTQVKLPKSIQLSHVLQANVSAFWFAGDNIIFIE